MSSGMKILLFTLAIQTVLIFLKAFNVIAFKWWLVLLPSWLYVGISGLLVLIIFIAIVVVEVLKEK